jgi:hypothetical protein
MRRRLQEIHYGDLGGIGTDHPPFSDAGPLEFQRRLQEPASALRPSKHTILSLFVRRARNPGQTLDQALGSLLGSLCGRLSFDRLCMLALVE